MNIKPNPDNEDKPNVELLMAKQFFTDDNGSTCFLNPKVIETPEVDEIKATITGPNQPAYFSPETTNCQEAAKKAKIMLETPVATVGSSSAATSTASNAI